MINLKEFLFEQLKQVNGLSSLIGTKIFPQKGPLGTALPFVTFNQANGSRLDENGIQNEFYDIKFWSKSILECEEAKIMIVHHFLNFRNNEGIKDINVTLTQDIPADEKEIYGCCVTLKITAI